jgi:excisionase family DNA binding protein
MGADPVLVAALEALRAATLVIERALATGETPDEALALTVRQTAERLQVHPNTVYRLMASGDLEGTTVGRRRRVTAASVRAYLGRHRGGETVGHRGRSRDRRRVTGSEGRVDGPW